MMTIHIDALELRCIIGVLDVEREHAQRVGLDIQIDYPYTVGKFLDYSHAVEMIEMHLKEEKYLLLEDALEGIKTLLFQAYPEIEQLKIKLSKPDILPNCSVGLSSVWSNHTTQ